MCFFLASNPAHATDVPVGFNPTTRTISLDGRDKPGFLLSSKDIEYLTFTLQKETAGTSVNRNGLVPVQNPLKLQLLSTQTRFEITGFVFGTFSLTNSRLNREQFSQTPVNSVETADRSLADQNFYRKLSFWHIRTYLSQEDYYYLLVPLDTEGHIGFLGQFPSTTNPNNTIKLIPENILNDDELSAKVMQSYHTYRFGGKRNLLLSLRLLDAGSNSQVTLPSGKEQYDLMRQINRIKSKL